MLKLDDCRIILGHDLRFIWDGRGASLPLPTPGPNGSWEEAPSQEARVHGFMRAEDVPQGHPGSGGPAAWYGTAHLRV
ncbi:hypothetical protein BGW80DRAFT_1344463, partial [Lactifluus volemus]